MRIRWIVPIVVLLMLFSAVGVLELHFRWVTIQANRQLTEVIQKHDLKSIERIASDVKTEKFLMQLPRSARPEKTTDSQGNQAEQFGGYSYLASIVGGKLVSVTMRYDYNRFWGILFPNFQLYKVALQNKNVAQ